MCIRDRHCAGVVPMAMREHDAIDDSEIGAQTGGVALERIFLRAGIEQNAMTDSAAMRRHEARKAMRGAAQAFAGHHPNDAPHHASRFAFDVRWRSGTV